MPATALPTVPLQITDAQIASYRRDGFVKAPSIISREEAAEFRAAALDVMNASTSVHCGDIFSQHVNVWTRHELLKRLTLHPNITRTARLLAGVPLRLWHDHLLIKKPRNKAPTEFHQDQPYWPHANSSHPISCWVALCDVPVERGCMTFIPGVQDRSDLEAQDLSDRRSLFEKAPDLEWETRVTLPLRAGDCTFHHGRCPHMANANDTDEPRVAMSIIYMDAGTTFTGRQHVVTESMELKVGDRLDGELFPEIG